jgi:predicted nucleic acid-binding Zn ribbon protein
VTWRPLPSPDDHTRPVGAVLERLHRTLGLARPDTIATIESNWSSLVGARVAPRCRVEALRRGELVVRTDDPAVAEQLRWAAGDLAGAVNALCDGRVVERVSVRVRRD